MFALVNARWRAAAEITRSRARVMVSVSVLAPSAFCARFILDGSSQKYLSDLTFAFGITSKPFPFQTITSA